MDTAIEGFIEDLVHEAREFSKKAKEQREREENLTKMTSVWGAACSLMAEFDLNVIILKGIGIENLMNALQTGEAADRNVRAARFGDSKYLLVDAEEISDPPDWQAVLNLLHEAAHLLTDQYDNFDESEGVCQVELVLARMISKETHTLLVKAHREEYGWNGEYADERKGQQWKEGAKRAKHILSKFEIIKNRPVVLRTVW